MMTGGTHYVMKSRSKAVLHFNHKDWYQIGRKGCLIKMYQPYNQIFIQVFDNDLPSLGHNPCRVESL